MKAVTLYRPGVLENVFGGFDRYLDSFFRLPWFEDGRGENFFAPQDRVFDRFSPVDIRETENAYIIEAELPGFDEKDIEVRLDGNTLTIESKRVDERKLDEKKEDKKDGHDGNYLVRERRAASFRRSFKLPENADAENIGAAFKNGILSLEIGKRAEAKTRLIEISK